MAWFHSLGGRSLGNLAVALGAAAVVVTLVLVQLAYHRSERDLEERYRVIYLQQAHMLSRVLESGVFQDRGEALRLAARLWRARKPRPADEYLCIMDRRGRLILHSQAPETVGDHVGDNALLTPRGNRDRRLRDVLDQPEGYVGDYLSSAGEPQIAAFAPVKRWGWVIGVHRSERALTREIAATFRYLLWTFWLVCGILVPLSLFLLHRSYSRDRRRRLEVEKKLRSSEQRLMDVLDNAQDGFFQTDAQGNVLNANRAYARMLGYPGVRAFLAAKPDARDFWADPVRRQELMAQVQAGDLEGSEALGVRRDGSRFWVSINARLVRGEDGSPAYFEGFMRDITRQKDNTQRLEAALRETNTLLREVHHRVKNNLQVVCSLLNLQLGRVSDPAAAQPIQDSRDRVAAMALIHEALYAGSELTEVDFQEYAGRLTSQLQAVYGLGARGVELRVEAPGLRLPLDKAVPCGLILTELLTNACKHAFPRGGGGRVTVRASRGEGWCQLVVADDGVGLSGEPSPGLGLELVQGLAQSQLGGSLTLQGEPGLRVEVRFPLPEG
jgi:PAS domain S-box-containing protein